MDKNRENRIKEKFCSGNYIIRCREEDCADMQKATMEEFLWFVDQNESEEDRHFSGTGKKIWEEMKMM